MADFGLPELRSQLTTQLARTGIDRAIRVIDSAKPLTNPPYSPPGSLEGRTRKPTYDAEVGAALAGYLAEVTEDLRDVRRDTMRRVRTLFNTMFALGLITFALAISIYWTALIGIKSAVIVFSCATGLMSLTFRLFWKLYRVENVRANKIITDMQQLEEMRLKYILDAHGSTSDRSGDISVKHMMQRLGESLKEKGEATDES